MGGVTAAVSTQIANPDAGLTDLLWAGGAGAVGGALLASPFAATGMQVLAAATVVGGTTNFATQAAFKGVGNVDLVETGIFAGLSAVSAIPSAAAAGPGLSVGAALGLTVVQAPKGVGYDLLGGGLSGMIPDFTVGQLTDSLGFTTPSPAEFGAPSLQTPTDFNSGYSFPSESTNLGSFDQLYNTW